MAIYKVLNKQVYSKGGFSLVPVRAEDRYAIMKWRNEQIYHLRQNKPLTIEDQDAYFENVVSKLFEQDQPYQILFSFLEGEKCIGYGGLVHINWIDMNAEISFIMNSALEKDFFKFYWKKYLYLIAKVAFEELELHKIFTYAYDLRPQLFEVLETSGFEREARLKEHSYFNGKFIDVIIHSKTIDNLHLRDATINDIHTTFRWANHPDIRKYAFHRESISFENHKEWFTKKIADGNCFYKILVKCQEPIGSFRLDINEKEGLISYLISPEQSGQGFGKRLLELALLSVESENYQVKILKGFVKKENSASIRIFQKFDFEFKYLNEEVIEFRKIIKHVDWE